MQARSSTLGMRLAAIWAAILVAIALAGAACGPTWEPRDVGWEDGETVLTEALEDAEPVADLSELKIAGRDLWAIAADAVLSAHPNCVSVAGRGRSSYEPTEMGIVKGLNNDSPPPADIADGYFVWLYGDPDRTYLSERRIVLLWLLPQRQYRPVMVAAEFVPKSDGDVGGPDVEWRRAAEVRAAYCYDAAGEELANFDRAALPPLDLSGLDAESASTEVGLRVRRPGEALCGESVTTDYEWGLLDENPPDYSGAAPGSDPTPEMLDALRDDGEEPDDFELWYVTPRRVLFASLDDRGQGSNVLGKVADVIWLGFDDAGVAVWGVETSDWLSLCDEEWED